MIGRPADDFSNVDVVGYYGDGHGHGSYAGRVRGHNPVFHRHDCGHSRGRGPECGRVLRGRHYCRGGGHGHNLFGNHNPFYRARNGHIVCRRGDNRPVLASPSHSERDRGSLCSENDNQTGDKSRRGVGGSAAGRICEESVVAFLKEDDLVGAPQSQAWVEVEDWKTLFVPCLFFLFHVHSPAKAASPRLTRSNPIYTLGSGWRSS
jgi:hypothetical protein